MMKPGKERFDLPRKKAVNCLEGVILALAHLETTASGLRHHIATCHVRVANDA